MGGLALVAGLAYKAWNDYQASQAGTAAPSPAKASPTLLPPPSESPFHPETGPGGASGRAQDFLVAMIAAAKADGHIDSAEQARIFSHLDDFGLDAEAKTFVMDEIRAPLDVERIVSLARTPAMAAELYAASLLAMDPDTPAERAYLDLLAARLGLEKGLVGEIERAARRLRRTPDRQPATAAVSAARTSAGRNGLPTTIAPSGRDVAADPRWSPVTKTKGTAATRPRSVADVPAQARSIESRHPHVAEHHVDRLPVEDLQRRLAAGRDLHRVARPAEDVRQHRADLRFVVDDQNVEDGIARAAARPARPSRRAGRRRPEE